eukprot:gnl/TRDRNA2_/TRDRNA2_185888_c0_seq1.p1 gnl/TRDRNA2_/TRDRNA2_185888_c0~~gnl/TRDRNA2_/TRDRNA2_185888_c0_seq1.p1  ORF type:complete len:470 (+),score=34.55 gnl/TRDRNA2_/TRDRNA2_185888_c0_seq1:70-1479(+)
MSKVALPVLIILAAAIRSGKAKSGAETTCLDGSMDASCSDFEASPSMKKAAPSADDESLNLLQTKAVLSKPGSRVPVTHSSAKSIRVLIGKAAHKIIQSRYKETERPLWQKSLRCSGPTTGDREECIGPSNCWGDCPTKGGGVDRCVQVSQTNWTRFLTLVHVRCELSMQVGFRPVKTRGGVINTYWNDKFLHAFDKPIWPGQKSWSTDLKTDHKGGNTFIVEFIPSNSKDSPMKQNAHEPQKASAIGQFSDLTFFLRTELTTCLDSKSCLDQIGDKAGLPLRESSGLLHQCLRGDMDKEHVLPVARSCKKWKRCLKRSDPSGQYQSRLLLLLNASDAAVPMPGHTSLKQSPMGSKCIYPPTEDPMSWNCDCYEQMIQRCRDIGASKEMEVCIRGQFCEHPNTCQHWKDAACSDETITDMKKRLHGALLQTQRANSISQSSALMSHAAPRGIHASAVEMDQSTEHKACS